MVRKILIFKIVTFLLLFFIFDLLIGVFDMFLVKDVTIKQGLKKIDLSVEAHPYKSYINKPGIIFYNNYVVNEYGHQVLQEDQDIAFKNKSNNEKRILFLGGSTTFQQWPFYFVEILNRKEDKFHYKAINAGTGGYTSQENLIDLIISGFSYQPDMVVAYLPINDIYWSSFYEDFKRDYTHMRISLKIIDNNKIDVPIKKIRKYPFFLSLIDIISYKKKYKAYMNTKDLMYYVTKQPVPWPKSPDYKNYDVSFTQTVDAVIDNIYNMKILCDARNIKFLLITQKIFPFPFGYASRNKFADLMDNLTLKAIESIKTSVKLKGIELLEMNKIFPNQWDNIYIVKTQEYFPGKKLDFSEKLAYDSMHFNDAALHLFAITIYEYLKNKESYK